MRCTEKKLISDLLRSVVSFKCAIMSCDLPQHSICRGLVACLSGGIHLNSVAITFQMTVWVSYKEQQKHIEWCIRLMSVHQLFTLADDFILRRDSRNTETIRATCTTNRAMQSDSGTRFTNKIIAAIYLKMGFSTSICVCVCSGVAFDEHRRFEFDSVFQVDCVWSCRDNFIFIGFD